MKRTTLLAGSILLILCITLTGCDLISGLLWGDDPKEDGGLPGLENRSIDYIYGMVEVNDDIYITSWLDDGIYSIDGTLFAATCEKPHGLAWDGVSTETPTFWTCDLNESKVRSYGGSSHVHDVGSEPVNLLVAEIASGDTRIFIADRSEDVIYVFPYTSGDFAVSNGVRYDLSGYMSSEEACGYIDMYFEGGNLFVTTDEYDGLIIIDLSTIDTFDADSIVTDPTIASYPYSETTGDLGALGVVYRGGKVTINTGSRILMKDLKDTPYAADDDEDWVVLVDDIHGESSDMDSCLDGFDGRYLDLVISDREYQRSIPSDIYLYTASGIFVDHELEEEIPQHVLKFTSTESSSSTSWEYDEVIDFDD